MIPLLVGLAGLALTLASLADNPPALTWQLIVMLGLCALGGLMPLRLRGLWPLPMSLPLVGALTLTSDTSVAMAAGLCAGLATALSFHDDAAGVSRSLRTGLVSGGALALAAGIASSGFTRLALSLPESGAGRLPPADQAMKLFLVMAGMMLVFWATTRVALSVSPFRHAARGVAASLIAATLALVLAGTLSVPALRDPLVAGLAAAGLTALLMTLRLGRATARAVTAERKARSGLLLVEAIALAIEARDRTSERHLRRMRVLALGVARRLGMSPEDLESLEHAALLHDIGKLVVPESILSKPAALSTDEYQLVSSHARVGAEILEMSGLPPGIAALVRHHHERYDGSGYPDGLVGIEIPLGARILAAVDTFEALTSERPHRRGLRSEDAAAFLERHAGSLFDPHVVRALVEHHHEFESELIAEEQSRAAQGSTPRPPAPGARALRPPFQTVLDRIASSQMEVYSLHEISRVLGSSLNIEESFSLISGKIRRLIHFSSCVLYVNDAERGLLRARFADGKAAGRLLEVTLPLGGGLSGWAAMQRRTVIGSPLPSPHAPDAARSDLESIASDPVVAALRCSLAAPLVVDDALIGVVALYDVAESPYTHQEEHLLAHIARTVGGAVRTGLLFEQTREHALTDPVTGLPNTRYLFMTFDQEAAKARERGLPLTLLVMDIDNFRTINEGFGHHAGDRFLAGIAKAIRSQMRLCDTCIRYAGDEFIALLPGLAGREVEDVVERLVEAARDYCLEARAGRPIRLTLSAGCATMPEDGEDFETLLAAAAGRMREQKARHGRPGPRESTKRTRPDPAGPAGDRSH